MKFILAIVIFSAVILFHEFGHFLLAKLNGVEVLEFSLGMGPRLFSRQLGETRYSIKAFPLGGSCMMKGEDTGDSGEGTYNEASVLGRFSIIFAGPGFNFILAFILSVILVSLTGYDPAEVMKVAEDSPAAKAGLQEGDIITSFQGYQIDLGKDLYLYTTLEEIESGQELRMTVLRDGQKQTISYIPEDYVRYLFGITFEPDSLKIAAIQQDMPAACSNIQPGDTLYALNGISFETPEEYSAYIQEHPLTGEAVPVTYLHNGLDYEETLVPKEYRVPVPGFSYNVGYVETENILQTFKYSILEVKYFIRTTVMSLKELILGRFGIQDLSGPIGVVDVIGETYEESKSEGPLIVFANMLGMAILLSANLGVMNLLPIPALDGGRLVFIIIEAIRRKPVNRDAEGLVHFVGFVALMVLMVFIMYQDILKLL